MFNSNYTVAFVPCFLKHHVIVRGKFENYVKLDPTNKDLKRKGYTAVAAKIARVAYGIVKNERDYRCYFESIIPGGKIPSVP